MPTTEALRELEKIIEPGKLKQIKRVYIKRRLAAEKLEFKGKRRSFTQQLHQWAIPTLWGVGFYAGIALLIRSFARFAGLSPVTIWVLLATGTGMLGIFILKELRGGSTKTLLEAMWQSRALEAFKTQDLGSIDTLMSVTIAEILLEGDKEALETATALINDRNFQGNIVELCITAKEL